jgi:hypothetical protein
MIPILKLMTVCIFYGALLGLGIAFWPVVLAFCVLWFLLGLVIHTYEDYRYTKWRARRVK